jgi:hypothetical protein
VGGKLCFTKAQSSSPFKIVEFYITFTQWHSVYL